MNVKKEIELSKEKKEKLLKEIKAFFLDEMGEDIGNLKADLVLDFVLNKIGKEIYNQALLDSKFWFKKRLDDLEADFYTLEK